MVDDNLAVTVVVVVVADDYVSVCNYVVVDNLVVACVKYLKLQVDFPLHTPGRRREWNNHAE